MNYFVKFSTLLMLLFALVLPACTVETVDDDADSVEIKNQVAQGFTDAGVPFVTETALVENTTLFSDEGYYFHLYRDTVECSGNISGVVRFFVPTDDVLTEGTYEGQGPFITNTSFFGCDVVITTVSDTAISGKVKGGNFEGDKNIEGIFTAEL